MDPATHRVTRGEVDIPLSPKEMALLELLIRHAGEVVTRTRILDHVWDFAYDGTSNVVDQYIAYSPQEDRQAVRTQRHRDHPRRRVPARASETG